MLLVGTAPADMARLGTAAAAAGFVNFMGYMGAFSGDLVTGYLRQHYNWQSAIHFWAAAALVAAGVVATLSARRARAGRRSGSVSIGPYVAWSDDVAPRSPEVNMQAIIIGAGRGQRLMPTTADTPKCFAEVGGRRILDWALAAPCGPTASTASPSSAATRSTRSGPPTRS